MSPSWRRASTSHAVRPRRSERVTTSTGKFSRAIGSRARRQPGQERARARPERRSPRSRRNGCGAARRRRSRRWWQPGCQRGVARRKASAVECEQALTGEQQADGRDERCCTSGSGDEREPVHTGGLNRLAARAIGHWDVLVSFLRRICGLDRSIESTAAGSGHGRPRSRLAADVRLACPPTVTDRSFPSWSGLVSDQGRDTLETQVGAVVRPRRQSSKLRRVTVPFFSGADVERAVSPHDAYDAVKAAFIAYATAAGRCSRRSTSRAPSTGTSGPCRRSATAMRC